MTSNELIYACIGALLSWISTSLMLVAKMYRLHDRNAMLEAENNRIKEELNKLNEL